MSDSASHPFQATSGRPGARANWVRGVMRFAPGIASSPDAGPTPPGWDRTLQHTGARASELLIPQQSGLIVEILASELVWGRCDRISRFWSNPFPSAQGPLRAGPHPTVPLVHHSPHAMRSTWLQAGRVPGRCGSVCGSPSGRQACMHACPPSELLRELLIRGLPGGKGRAPPD